jgi:hypothetical protein
LFADVEGAQTLNDREDLFTQDTRKYDVCMKE